MLNTCQDRLDQKLQHYGIQNEHSDMRVHVCVQAKEAWCYPTSQGVVTMYSFPKASAYQGGIKTGVGHLVPVDKIPFVRLLRTDPQWFDVFPVDQDWFGESQKGNLAVEIVCKIISAFNFPYLPTGWKTVDDVKLQVEGQDIILGPSRVQVKCDWKGGRKPKGTGNLFLQVEECNPWGKH